MNVTRCPNNYFTYCIYIYIWVIFAAIVPFIWKHKKANISTFALPIGTIFFKCSIFGRSTYHLIIIFFGLTDKEIWMMEDWNESCWTAPIDKKSCFSPIILIGEMKLFASFDRLDLSASHDIHSSKLRFWFSDQILQECCDRHFSHFTSRQIELKFFKSICKLNQKSFFSGIASRVRNLLTKKSFWKY